MSFTIQRNRYRDEYHCYLGQAKFETRFLNARLQEAITYVRSNEEDATNAISVFLQIENGHRSYLNGDFSTLMETISIIPHLQEFSIAINYTRKFPSELLLKVLTRATTLEKLTLSDVEIEGSIYELAEALQKHERLKRVNLIRCYCRPVHVLLKALSGMERLQEVCLDGTCIGQQRDVDALAALKALCLSKSIQSITLKDLEDEAVIRQLLIILETLQSNTTLKRLSLDAEGQDILPSGIIHAVARLIQHNQGIQVLILSWTGEMVLPIVEALRYNGTLVEFRFTKFTYQHRRSRFSKHFLRQASAMLQHNTTLQYLLHEAWPEEVRMYLALNSMGRKQLLHSSSSTHEDWARAISSYHRDHNATFYLLSHNPSFLVSTYE